MAKLEQFCVLLLLLLVATSSSSAARDGKAWMSTTNAGNHASMKNPDVMGYIQKMLPDAEMPESMASLVSPLPRSAVARFLTEIKDGGLLSSDALAEGFCSSAGLLCGRRLEGEGVSAASRASRDVGWDSIGLRDTDSSLQPTEADKAHYFLFEELVPGYSVPGSVFSVDPAMATSSFLPRPLAQALTSGADIAAVMKQLHISPESPMAAQMKSTIKACRSVAKRGRGFCVASVEELVKVASLLALGKPGSDYRVEILSSSNLGSDLGDRFKTVNVEPKNVDGGFARYMSCHHMPFPFQADLCHSEPATQIYSVTLESTSVKGRRITGVAVCHTDTALFDPDHVAFKVLGTKPGRNGVCHWREPNAYTFVATLQ